MRDLENILNSAVQAFAPSLHRKFHHSLLHTSHYDSAMVVTDKPLNN